MTEAGRELSLASHFLLESWGSRTEGAEPSFVRHTLQCFLGIGLSRMMGVVVEEFFCFCAPGVQSLLGSKSGLYCGVLGLRVVLWSSCVMTMQRSCHLSLIGFDHPTRGSKLTDPPSVFLCLSIFLSFSCYPFFFLLQSSDISVHIADESSGLA